MRKAGVGPRPSRQNRDRATAGLFLVQEDRPQTRDRSLDHLGSPRAVSWRGPDCCGEALLDGLTEWGSAVARWTAVRRGGHS